MHLCPRPSGSSHPAVRLLLVAPFLAVVACQHGMMGTYQRVRPYMADGRYGEAAEMLTAAKDEAYNKRDRVMFWLDRGTLRHYAGDLEASTEDLVAAEKAMDVLFTKSVSRGVASMLTNPTVTEYEGEDYEKVLLYLYTALNHAMAGDLENALVEVRRAQDRLHALEVYYRQEGGLGTIYTQDAFLYWFAGILLEEEGSHNDALVAFRRAFAAYQDDYAPLFGIGPPPFLAEDVVRAALRSGMDDLASEYRALGASGRSTEALAANGELIVIIGVGESPLKYDTFITAPAPGGYLIRVALPALQPIPFLTRRVRLDARGVRADATIVEPVETIAVENYAHRLPNITAMATARAIAKYAAVKGIEIAGNAASRHHGSSGLGDLLGGVVSVVNYFTEEADKRSWRTLPAEFHVARLYLPEGTHRVDVVFEDAMGREVDRISLEEVTIRVGRRTFRSVRSLE